MFIKKETIVKITLTFIEKTDLFHPKTFKIYEQDKYLVEYITDCNTLRCFEIDEEHFMKLESLVKDNNKNLIAVIETEVDNSSLMGIEYPTKLFCIKERDC